MFAFLRMATVIFSSYAARPEVPFLAYFLWRFVTRKTARRMRIVTPPMMKIEIPPSECAPEDFWIVGWCERGVPEYVKVCAA